MQRLDTRDSGSYFSKTPTLVLLVHLVLFSKEASSFFFSPPLRTPANLLSLVSFLLLPRSQINQHLEAFD
jgi:hypothetical protein